MTLPRDDAAALAGRWTEGVLLKRDVFSTVERGRFRAESGERGAVLRRLDQVPWWSFPLALHLFNREKKALTRASGLDVGPPLLWAGRRALARGFIDGVALHLARPIGDRAYFASAKAALRRLHRAGICHNDLAKEQNWLRGADGRAYLTDFQLAVCFRRRSRLFRIAAYEDLRHLLKHKRRYAPEALTAAERRILARKSVFARVWLMTGKKVYRAITRGVFNFTDREGGGRRLVNDAPPLIARLKSHPQVRDAAIVAFADRRSGVGLYAFVEASGETLEAELTAALSQARDLPPPPEHLQVVERLPRDADGRVRSEFLQLVAMNQVDLIEPLLVNASDRAAMKGLLDRRKNLRDRFSF
ncbi:serine/threonine protein kinase [Bradyrhizobium sp. WD16]|uniref:AMP-binding enzyme n=1 Tax=Bradyrhizobium sp. WD16 TaxID=1521768 RepID=UPI0020A5AA7B|nr:serine/threonine protein kinase [Bradyrhizobium sp. WD16]UTD30594.1 serine/threonine protein kinase [Bradyrhizobium sp. WD16]